MNCSLCNSPLQPGFKFCMKCGAPIDMDATVMLSQNKKNPSPAPSATTTENQYTEAQTNNSVQYEANYAQNFSYENYQAPVPSQPPVQKKKRGSTKSVIVILSIVGAFILCGGIIFAISTLSDKSDNPGKGNNSTNSDAVIHEETTNNNQVNQSSPPQEMLERPYAYFAGNENVNCQLISNIDTNIPAYIYCTPDSAVAQQLLPGSHVTVLGEYEDWYCIHNIYTSNGYAWIKKQYVSQYADNNTDPTGPDSYALELLNGQTAQYMTVVFPHPDCTYSLGEKGHYTTNAPGEYHLQDGEVVWVYGILDGYAYVKAGDIYGWCDASCFETSSTGLSETDVRNLISYFNSQPDEYYRVYDTGYSGLNLRAADNTEAQVITVLQESEIVLVYGIRDGWAFVKTEDPRTQNNIYGWCSTDFLQYHSSY